MVKILIIVPFLSVLILQVKGQNEKSSYHAYINLATEPSVLGFNGRLFLFKSDTLSIMNRKGQKNINDSFINIYDTTYYLLTDQEKQKIIVMIQSVDSLESIFNFCIIDGLRFYFSCGLDTFYHTAWVSNAYDPKIFLFVDIINNHVPKNFQIPYNKDLLIKEEKKCLKERFGIKK